jgi:hypothetical protein
MAGSCHRRAAEARAAWRIGAGGNRAQAAAWAVEHGFTT